MSSNKYNLTFPESNIYLVEKFNDGTTINTIAGILRIEDAFDEKVYDSIVNKLIKLNDALRIRIYEENGYPYQIIDEYNYEEIECIDMSDKTSEYIEEYMYNCVKIPIKFINSKLYEFKIIKSAENKGYIFMKLHHIVSDAWTLGQIINQLIMYYDDYINSTNQSYSIPSYIDFMKSEKEYISSDRYVKDEQFWREYLKDIKLPISLKETTSKISTEAERYTVILEKRVNDKIMKYTRENNTSPYALFIAALSTYLYRVKNENDFVLGSPVLNRSNFKEKQALGLFVSTMPIRVKIKENMKFLELIKQIGSDTMSLFRRQKYPIKKILENLYSSTDVKGKIFNIVLSYQNARSNIKDNEIFSTKWIFNGHVPDDIHIHIMDMDNDGILTINYDYLKNLFERVDIEYLHERLMVIIDNAINDSEVNIEKISIMSKEEENKILYEFNETTIDHQKDKTVTQFFEEQVAKTPDNIALVFENQQMTYRELNEKSNQLAHYLRENYKIGLNDIVGIIFKRGFEMIISIFAISKLGAAYLPIDYEFPQDRINYMIENSGSKLIITNDGNLTVDIQMVNISSFEYINYKNTNLPKLNDSKELIYIMYTSGSTGLPKATMIKHGNVINYIEAVKKYMDYTNIKNVLSVTTISFDIFVFELFPTLCLGLSLFIANEEQQKLPEKLIEFIYVNKIEKINTTPSRIQMVLDICRDDKYLQTIKEYNLGGEPITSSILYKIKSRFNATIYNCYGPTETTVYSTFKNLTYTDKITIGRPINNTQIYILDKSNCLLPIGVEGQICIAGKGVGMGYLKNEKLTNEKYISNEFLSSDDKIYLTGDIGRWNNNGELECLGRYDNQIKINGRRIELTEISEVISKYPNVKEVVVRVLHIQNFNYLCAYIVGRSVNIGRLKEYLFTKLPKYMIPTYYEIIDKMPLSHNGKIDINKLPQPSKVVNQTSYVEPKTAVEKDICKIISQYVNIEKLSTEDNFFEMGIDSLMIIKIQVSLFSMGYLFSTQDFYNYPTISSLSKLEDKNKNKNKNTNKHADANVDNRTETFRDNSFDTINLKRKKKIKNILLTGATGFLGIHILNELLKNKENKIYCLVREKTTTSKSRLENKFKYYFDVKRLDDRIHVLKGDLTKDKLGLTDEDYQILDNKIDEIIHVAANVKYYGDFRDFELNNIVSTENIVKLSYKNNKRMNYISSLGVSGHFLVEHKEKNSIFSEDVLYIGQNYEQNNYVKSKFLVEQSLYKYNENSKLNLRIFRVGNLTGRYSDGKFQENMDENAFYNILKSILKLKAIPNSMLSNSIDFSPVDIVAKAIVKIVKLENSINRTYHIANSNITTTKEIVALMNKLGFNIEIMSEEKFSNFVHEISRKQDLSEGLDGLINDINNKNRLIFNAGVILNSKKSNFLLSKLGIRFKKMNVKYFKKIIKTIEGR